MPPAGAQTGAHQAHDADPGPARRPIAVLPALVANQIAAGEVVERPASVVKELMENALDAGASRVVIELEAGGGELIRVTDDGAGIPADQLTLALAPHATSKVSSSEELDGIATMGFRGEALASITSVSRLSLRSRTVADAGATVIEAEGDRAPVLRPASGPVGTCVTVRNLFFNTPARRKFLRTPATEQGRCVDVAKDLAVAHPHVGVTIVCDGRTVFEAPAGQSPRQRALAVLGQELEGQLLEVRFDAADRLGLGAASSQAGSLTLWGLAGLPALARATASEQYIALNGRIVRDRTIQHALKEAYRGLIEPGRHPTCVLLIEIDPRSVDVNVHPAKSEVRFRDSSLVHSTVLRSVRQALQGADLTADLAGDGARVFGPGLLPSTGAGVGAGSSQAGAGFSARAFADTFKDRFTQVAPGATPGLDFGALRAAAGVAGPLHAPALSAPGHELAGAPGQGRLLDAAPTTRPLQVHNSFLVTQDAQGMVIIDQHALHERVMFQRLLARVIGQGDSLESQALLVPATVRVGAGQLEALEAIAPLLARIGVQAAPIGPGDLAVHAFPTFLFDRGVEAGPFLAELLERAHTERWAPTGADASALEATLSEVLDMMACKAAIKAGNQLSEQEIADLLASRETVERSASCPHGRPTSVRITIRDLEKLFHRA
jgi:DNA mismatch repair protein MutL